MIALKIIDQNIPDIKEKIDILQRYAPKLLAPKSKQKKDQTKKDKNLEDIEKTINLIVKDIAKL